MKGIILAGGSGTRLYPMTKVISKQLQPVYDKPMIYYPLSTLMLAGIRDILIITTPEDNPLFVRQLGDGSNFGINLSYAIQNEPKGLAEAFTIGEKFVGNCACAMILGDNIFYGNGFVSMLKNAKERALMGKATNFGYEVLDPERFGIMELDSDNNIIGVEEKPENPKSNFAITGLYFYPSDIVSKAKDVKPSKRGELEITSINEFYLQEKRLVAELLGGGFSWFDTGTPPSLYDAVSFVHDTEQRRKTIICCPEQIAYVNGWISKDELLREAEIMKKNDYGKFLYDTAFRKLKKNL